MNLLERIKITGSLLLLCACAASASGVAGSENAPPHGYARTGAMSACVEVEKTGAIMALDESAFLVHGDNAAYLSIADEPCVGAAGKRIEYARQEASICRDDVVTIIDQDTGEQVAACALGDFEALLKTEAAPAHNRQD